MSAELVADSFARAMAAAGTRAVFGLPGGGNNLEVVGALRARGVEFVLAHTETAAVIMAAIYADAAGVPSAAVVTRGPGAASAVNGAAQALLDRQPVIVLTDAVSERDRPRVLHQLLDQQSLYEPVTKGSGVLSATDPDTTMAEALDGALTAPRGPIHLDFDPGSTAHGVVVPGPNRQSRADRRAEMSTVQELVSGARRPVALLGVGARDAPTEIRELLEGTDVPTLVTYRAKGVIPESWDNFAGLLTGATVESAVLESADLLLAIGR